MEDIKKNNKQLTKKILKRFLGFGFFGLLFFGLNNDYIYAQENVQTSSTSLQESMQETKALLDIILKIIYMISRPLIVIAGNAMDNSLVYGAFFHLDAPLRFFWNIMKNFANYALGFVLLYHILKSLFSRKGIGSFKDKDSPLGIIKKVLIAGILIQASRRLLTAIIDISTIATYSIGGMPLTILKNSDLGDQKILGVNSTMNLSDSQNVAKEILDDTVIYWTYGDDPEYKISTCKILDGGDYIIGKEINSIPLSGGNGTGKLKLEEGICILGSIPYRFNEFPELDGVLDNNEYNNLIENAINSNPTLSGYQECGFVIPIFTQLKYDPDNCNLPQSKPLLAKSDFGQQGGSGRINNIVGTTISTLIDKSKGFVGPLITIYSSTLNFGQIVDTKSGGDSISFGIVLKFMIKTLIGIMLILPIVALAVIMIARIGILWIAIAFTPIIVIDQVFEFKIFEKMKFLEISNLIKLIFAPVLIVFGLSMCLIFMSTLTNILNQNQTDFSNSGIASQKEATLQGFGITQSEPNSYTILGTWTFRTKLNIGGGLDNISYLLINIFGIALMWSFLFWTISQTGSIGESIGGKLKGFGENLAGNLPIVPISGGLGLNQVIGSGGSGGILNKMSDQVTQKMSNQNQKKLEDAFGSGSDETDKGNENNGNKDNNTTQTINDAEAKKIMDEIQTLKTNGNNNLDEAKIKDIVKEQTGKEIQGGVADWIRQPENIKLLFGEFVNQNPGGDNQINEFTNTFGIKPDDIQNIPDIKTQTENYQKSISTIESFLEDLNKNKKFEALFLISNQNKEIKIGDKTHKVKYNKDENKYQEDTSSQ